MHCDFGMCQTSLYSTQYVVTCNCCDMHIGHHVPHILATLRCQRSVGTGSEHSVMTSPCLSQLCNNLNVHVLCCAVLCHAMLCCALPSSPSPLQPGASVGVCPSARRGHCLEAAQGRFLLLHGGYSGTSQLLQDTWAYDTHRDRWLPVDVQGELAGLKRTCASAAQQQQG